MPRRSFLYALGLALLMLFTLRWRACWWPFIFRPPKGILPSRPNVFREGEERLVSVVHGRDVEAAVRKAIDLVGGIEKLDVQGKSILLKPNILDGSPLPQRPIQR